MNRQHLHVTDDEASRIDTAIELASAIGHDVGYLAAMKDVADLARLRESQGKHFTPADAATLAAAAVMNTDEVQG